MYFAPDGRISLEITGPDPENRIVFDTLDRALHQELALFVGVVGLLLLMVQVAALVPHAGEPLFQRPALSREQDYDDHGHNSDQVQALPFYSEMPHANDSGDHQRDEPSARRSHEQSFGHDQHPNYPKHFAELIPCCQQEHQTKWQR